MTRSVRKPIATLLAACLMLGGGASRATAVNYDPGYQNGGTLQLPMPHGVFGQVARECAIGGDRLNLAARFGYNDPASARPWSRWQKLAVSSISLRPSQAMRDGIAAVRWHRQRIPTGHIVLSQSFDSLGGFAYVTHSPRPSQAARLKLFRVLTNGNRDAAFGGRGYISVTVAGLTGRAGISDAVRVTARRGGGVQLVVQTANRQVIMRFTRSGRPDKRWAKNGALTLAAAKPPAVTSASASITPDGGLLIAADALPGKPAGDVVGALRFDSGGRLVGGWADGGFWRPPVPGGAAAGSAQLPARVLLTSVRADGDFAMAYTNPATADPTTPLQFKVAYVSRKTGVTTLFNDAVGQAVASTAGVPSAQPQVLGESSSGTIFAHAVSFFDDLAATRGQATRLSTDGALPAGHSRLDIKGFAIGALAVDRRSRFLYLCGAQGLTPKSAKYPRRSRQLESVAVRRVKL